MSDTFEQARDFFARGLVHYEAGRFTQADSAFAASLSLLPGRVSTLTNLGATRVKLGRFDEAAQLLEEALTQEPGNVEALGHRATALAELGQHQDALDCVERGLTLNPAVAHLWSLRGSLLRDLGHPREAVAAFQQAIARGADNELNRYQLAALSQDVQAPPNAPRPYVESLFDSYAEGFEEHLVQVLNYRVPEALVEHLQRMRPRFTNALDLGCGTGLCGVLLRPLADRVDAVDLSGRMVERARARGVYDDVTQADLVEYLQRSSRTYELVLAADVFVYLGALEAVFAAVAGVLQPAGVFCFSVEAGEADRDFTLRPSLRYAHSLTYIRKLCEQHGLGVSDTRSHPIREDQGQAIAGHLVWLVKR